MPWCDLKSRKTSLKPESLTWPHKVPTTLAFLSWLMFVLGCLTVASLSTVVLCSRLGAGVCVCGGGLFTPYLPPQNPNHKPPHDWCPLSLSWPQRQTPGQLDAAWNPPQLPHNHRQWPPPSCPWPITQNITINSCPAAKQPTQQSLQSDSGPLVHVKIALSEGRKWSWWREVSALGYDGILHVT